MICPHNRYAVRSQFDNTGTSGTGSLTEQVNG
jgi:hypothetical protein